MRIGWKSSSATIMIMLSNGARLTTELQTTRRTVGTKTYNTARWFLRGLAPELLSNLMGVSLSSKRPNSNKYELDYDTAGSVAVVTGATGGIGSELCRGLSEQGYHVIVAARDSEKGHALVDRLRRSGGSATYVRLHADQPRSALDVASAVARHEKSRGCALLVHNAAVMGTVTRRETLRTNLIGPAALTLALLPELRRYNDHHGSCRPVVVHVSSSSHLRASHVIDGGSSSSLGRGENDDEDRIDADLSAYGRSKLGLMQLSTLLRTTHSDWLTVVDAHPGIVWTGMLRGALGLSVSKLFEMTGLYRRLYRSPEGGAEAILAATQFLPSSMSAASEQTYFCNGRPGGFASKESRDLEAARRLWRTYIKPVVEEIAPEECRILSEANGVD